MRWVRDTVVKFSLEKQFRNEDLCNKLPVHCHLNIHIPYLFIIEASNEAISKLKRLHINAFFSVNAKLQGL